MTDGFTLRPVWMRTREYMLPGALIATAVAVPLLLSLITRSLGIPHNDAWSHARIARTFAETGRIELVGWNRSALVGQIVVLGPLGRSIAAQNIFVAVCAAVGLVATWVFVRRRTSRGHALLVVGTIAAIPEFGLLSTSFMSDVPAFAGMMCCLVFTDRAISRTSAGWAATALATGFWALTVREQAALALVVSGARIFSDRALAERAPRIRWVLPAVTLMATVIFETWRRTLAHDDPIQPILQPMTTLYVGIYACFTASLYLLPVICRSIFAPWTRRTALTATAISVFALLLTARLGGQVFLGNYLSPLGAYGGAAALDRHVFPSSVWNAAATAAALALGPAAVRLAEMWLREAWSWTYLACFTLGTGGQALIGQSTFARYLLPALPVIAVLIYRPEPTASRLKVVVVTGQAAVAASAVAVSALSFMLTSNALAYDGARWAAANRLVSQGIPAYNIDGGMEWVGFHSSNYADLSAIPKSPSPSWYVPMMKEQVCASVTGVKDHAMPVGETFSYFKFAIFQRIELRTYISFECRTESPVGTVDAGSSAVTR